MKRLFLIPLRLLVSARPLLAFIAFCFGFSVASQTQTQIVAFGASNVAGYGVRPTQAWPAQLEVMLKAKGYPSGTKIEMLDMGGGYFNNQKRTNLASQVNGKADMTAIETQLKSRSITVIPENTGSMPLAYRQTDKIHLTPEGHKIFATHLLPLVVSALGGSSSGG